MLPTVERVLGDVAGTTVRVVGRRLLAEARGRVERLSIEPSLDGVGSTVLVKARALDRWSVVSLATERAALAAVEGAGVDLAPRVLGWSEQAGLLVMTDVGVRTVDEVLAGGDARQAEAALVELAKATAALHRVRLEGPLVTDHQTWTIGAHAVDWDQLQVTAAELGFPRADRADGDVASVVDALTHPGRLAAFVHGDLTPNNAVLGAPGRCRLVDFEGAGRQHLGVDACMLRFPFAWYGRWALLPAPVQAAMESAYRTALDRPADEVDQAIAVGCAAMTLVRLNRLPRIDDPRQDPGAARRRRVQIVSTVEVAIDAAARAGALPGLVSWLSDLVGEMRSRWPEAGLRPPVFPAFG